MATERREPKVIPEHAFLNIARDFCRPLDCVREAISNALDFHAKTICIKAWVDSQMPGDELVIEITDDGDGMDLRRLEAFFNLGDSTHIGSNGEKLDDATGEKGHGTKTYYNSRQIEVYTSVDSQNGIYALMDEPLSNLLHRKLPGYESDDSPTCAIRRGTKIVIRGFNNNGKRHFAHRVLKDHILWFTKFSDFSWVFEETRPKTKFESKLCTSGPKLFLHGLGYENEWEEIKYGHFIPPECTSKAELKTKNVNEPMRWYVKRWFKKGLPVKEYPGIFIDVFFSLEGDLSRRDYNPMISYHGKKLEGDYTIEQRYGLWACKNYLPVKQVNDWFSRGKSEWTRFHAFVNCQSFSLTANRANIDNTDDKLLEKIEETVSDYYENNIAGSREFAEYVYATKEQEGYRNKKQETDDFRARKARALKKHTTALNGVELLSPGSTVRGARGQEIGVHCLFAQLSALKPDLFPFKVVDYDTHRGYDCLITHPTPSDLSALSWSFLEFKYVLDLSFNHSFENLHYIVCWDCNIAPGTIVKDLVNEERALFLSTPDQNHNYTAHYLQAVGKHPIEVFVLKKYITEKLGINFQPKIP